MIVLNNVHGSFTLIRFSCFGDAVDRDCFLEDTVSAVFFVPQDIHDHVLAEAEILSGNLDFFRLQRLRDHLDRLTGEEHLVDPDVYKRQQLRRIYVHINNALTSKSYSHGVIPRRSYAMRYFLHTKRDVPQRHISFYLLLRTFRDTPDPAFFQR